LELIRHAGATGCVDFAFRHTCVGLDADGCGVELEDEDGKLSHVEADFVVAADGAFSAVRRLAQRGARANYQQQVLAGGYKELTIPPGPAGTSRIEWQALHVWPRRERLIVSHPNTSGSHTCTVLLPFEGERSFASLRTPAAVEECFAALFPDLLALVPDLA